MVGVTGSIPVAPTTYFPDNPLFGSSGAGYPECCDIAPEHTAPARSQIDFAVNSGISDNCLDQPELALIVVDADL